MLRLLWFFGLPALVFAQSLPAGQPAPVASPLEPRESLARFQIDEGLVIELAAAEPQVIDPVSVAFDEQGRMWVVEMRDYPNGPPEGQPPRSCLKLLQDRDGDGYYETAHVVADELLFPTGVQPWRGGALVTLEGEVAWFADTDGDLRADRRETWFRGFSRENPQLRANHPRFALDNHIYVANGLRGGTVLANADHWGTSLPGISIQGKDFRFDPLTGRCQAVAGHGQFGLTFDDFGRRFICTNRNPCRQVVLEDRHQLLNPFLAIAEVEHDVSPPAEHSRLFPLSRAWTTSTLHAHQFTAACGVHRYRGDWLPAPYRESSLTCDPTANLVHRDLLKAGAFGVANVSSGQKRQDRVPSVGSAAGVAVMHSVYATPDRDFLATPDEWFRPVDLADGPDGALYVVDMYRAVIEHPEWVPEELKRRPDLRHGDDRGRIYRVRPAGQGPRQPAATALAGAAHDELLAALEDANGWRRDTAARLIFERQARSLAPPLEEMALKSKHAAARARALWLLEGLAALSDAVLIEALADKVGGVQEQALILCEARLTNSADLERAILEFQPAQEFDAPRVLFQHVLTLAHAKDSSAKFNLLANYALQFAADSWMRRAAFIAAGKAPRRLLEAILSREAPASSPGPAAARDYSGHQLLLVEAASLIGARQVPEEIEALLAMLVSLWELRAGNDREALERMVLAGLAGLGDGLVRRGGSLGATVAKLESARAGVEQALRPIYMEAARIAQDPTGKLPRRGAALALLRHAPFSLAGQALLALASDPADQALRLEAISALAGHDDRAADLALLEQFVAGTPAVRRAAQQALLRAAPRINLLFDAISTGGVSAARIDPAAAQALRAHADAGIRGRANELFAALTPENRKGVLEAYQPALALEADAHKGREVFEKHCAGCHRVAGLGVDVAPDIADSRTKTPAQLLVDILNPNQAIDGNYVSYTALLASGQTESGVITAETSTSVTLRQAEGKTLVLLRADLQELRSTGVSLMPEGFEKQITLQQMADLLLFLKNWRYLDGQTPLGK